MLIESYSLDAVVALASTVCNGLLTEEMNPSRLARLFVAEDVMDRITDEIKVCLSFIHSLHLQWKYTLIGSSLSPCRLSRGIRSGLD